MRPCVLLFILVGSCLGVEPRSSPRLGPELPLELRRFHRVTVRCEINVADRNWLQQQLVNHNLTEAWLACRYRIDSQQTVIEVNPLSEQSNQQLPLGDLPSGHLNVKVEVKSGPDVWLDGSVSAELSDAASYELSVRLHRRTTHLTLLLIDLPDLPPNDQLQITKRLSCTNDPNQTDQSEIVKVKLDLTDSGGYIELDGLASGHWIGVINICDCSGRVLTSGLISCKVEDIETIVMIDWQHRRTLVVHAHPSVPTDGIFIFRC